MSLASDARRQWTAAQRVTAVRHARLRVAEGVVANAAGRLAAARVTQELLLLAERSGLSQAAAATLTNDQSARAIGTAAARHAAQQQAAADMAVAAAAEAQGRASALLLGLRREADLAQALLERRAAAWRVASGRAEQAAADERFLLQQHAKAQRLARRTLEA